MMNRYWDNEICGDFYEQLDDELRKYNMSIKETDKVETYFALRTLSIEEFATLSNAVNTKVPSK